jgi:hypothetical protein
VTNSAPYAVRVATPQVIPGIAVSEAFAYRIAPTARGLIDSAAYPQVDVTYIPFAPAGMAGSTRRVVFDDFPIFWGASAGQYDVTGIFLSVASDAVAVRVRAN